MWNWQTEGNHKNVSVNEEIVKTEMREGVHAFFPASRHETPDWLNSKSIEGDIIDGGINVSANRYFSDQLNKPIWVKTCAEENIGWILDVLLDSSIDVELLYRLQVTDKGERFIPNASLSQIRDIENRNILRNAIRNVDQVLQKTLQDSTAKLHHTFRNHRLFRLVIELEGGQTILSPHSLSGGQSQLFHLFTTIIRYGESTDINKSIHLSDITGIVIIDEIDVNLHPPILHDVLPQLIGMFPKVQFIVSSHSPLFLLGMEKRFGVDRVTILEMPDGKKINSERYSEFGKAFEYYQSTERYAEKIKQHFANMTKPVVLTEGKTDARYIQTALELLGEEKLLNSLDIRPVGKEGVDGDDGGGKSGLDNFHKIYTIKSLIFHQPILLFYDSDVKEIPEPIDKLSVKRIQENPENAKVSDGIENLFPDKLFEECFYDETVREKGDGGKVTKLELNKTKFCDWICEQKNVDHFAKFDNVVQILKEFVEAHLPTETQQASHE